MYMYHVYAIAKY